MRPGEAEDAVVLTAWLRGASLLFLHVPNEGKRSGRTGAFLRRTGLAKGAPDYLVFTPPPLVDVRGVAIELKSLRGRATPEQRQWLADLESAGWAAQVCRGWRAAVEFLESLGFKGPAIRG